MQPHVSVVIPSYQCAQYVSQAVESVLIQQYPAYLVEIIVVDDGSTDNTREVLAPYTHRIRYLHQANRGLASARNTGIRAARAPLVAFLDADDYWLPGFLASTSEAASRNGDCIITSDFFESFNERVAEVSFYDKNGLHWAFDLPASEQLSAALESFFLVPSMTMVPQSVFSHVGFFDETLAYGEDSDFFQRCMEANHRVVLVAKPLGVYRRSRPGALSARLTLVKARDRVRILSRYRHQVSKKRWSNVVGTMHHVGFNEAITQRDYSAAMRHALGLLLNPGYWRTHLIKRRSSSGRLSRET
jgi:glycosyltransferase involved in cell wall biosynthesis